MKKLLGELIKDYFLKSGLQHNEFAKRINCTRNNVYNIFLRANVDVELLGRISNVLNHNFFEDIAKDMNLVTFNPETKEEELHRKSVMQMFDVMPIVLEELGIHGHLSFASNYDKEFKDRLPDFFLFPFHIIFCIGEHYKDRVGSLEGMFQYDKFISTEGKVVYIQTNKLNNTQMIDVKLEYMSKGEWVNLMKFIVEDVLCNYSLKTIEEIKTQSLLYAD